ncbi:FRG domain-containing protein [Chromohalobacter canadensis]|uniref:FRG domain-containing protein n=1 Tax=Chromohalobacter canadensis TaxID=141389 RepID=UPI001FE34876|nr:FRG domain-containing protein [Chromohalobacter canadensis]
MWGRGRYIFRGQPCSSFGLAPAALRTVGPMAATSVMPSNLIGSERQVLFEVQVLRAFIKACDAAGIQIPGDSEILRDKIQSLIWELGSEEDWPPKVGYPVLATAQHHGVPTCLLDWTRRSYVACYFAASAVLHTPAKSGRLAIWAFNTEKLSDWGPVEFLEMPGATSANLAAQDGVFTVSTLKATMGGGLESTTVERLLEYDEHQDDPEPLLWKLTLPASEAAALLALCADFGVKGSTLFPGYEGVAREIRDKAFAGELGRTFPLRN